VRERGGVGGGGGGVGGRGRGGGEGRGAGGRGQREGGGVERGRKSHFNPCNTLQMPTVGIF